MFYIHVTKQDFIRMFIEDRDDRFSEDALEYLFDWYGGNDEWSEPREVDIIEICETWTEYEDLNEVSCAYEVEPDEVIETLANHTTVVTLDNEGILVMDF